MQGVVGLDNFGIQGSVNLLATGIKGVVEMGTVAMQGSVGIICTPNTDVYLRVTPQTLWFFKENEILDVDVISNIKWIVK